MVLGSGSVRVRSVARKLVPYVISAPDLVDHPERVSEKFRKNLNLDNLGVKPATADGPSESTRARPRAATPGHTAPDQ
ncbi:hypothetical protein ACQPWR_22115 [Micromonospora vinacea]|uniref:hypothetical protein n=1 Tax=Micromonospora vinacea TaxID=709878 RepID=UPI003D8DB8BE